MNEQAATINHAKDTLVDLAIRFGPRLLTAVLIMAVGIFVSRAVGRWVERGLARRQMEPPIRLLLTRSVWLICIVMFLIMALQNLGVELLPLIAGLGVAGAGIALATQGVLSNVAAGLSIIFAKPFRVGEYIAIAGVEGVVHTITLFSTTLQHADRSMVIIPNRKIVGEILHNYGHIRQVDLTAVVALIREVLQANPRVLKDPEAIVQAVQLGDSAVAIAVKPWVSVQDLGPATGEVNAAVVQALQGRGITIPVPQREVRLIGQQA
jgi:small conductance mechanosensitive channel